jgi:hypothetical protein
MKPIAPAIYRGPQKDLAGKIRFHWWDLTAGIPGHPAGSTVSDRTLLDAGFSLPEGGAR